VVHWTEPGPGAPAAAVLSSPSLPTSPHPPGSSMLLARTQLISALREKSLLRSQGVSARPAAGLLLAPVQGREEQRNGGGEQEASCGGPDVSAYVSLAGAGARLCRLLSWAFPVSCLPWAVPSAVPTQSHLQPLSCQRAFPAGRRPISISRGTFLPPWPHIARPLGIKHTGPLTVVGAQLLC